MSDDSNYESESSESDEEFVADLNANEEGWTIPQPHPKYAKGLTFPDEWFGEILTRVDGNMMFSNDGQL